MAAVEIYSRNGMCVCVCVWFKGGSSLVFGRWTARHENPWPVAVMFGVQSARARTRKHTGSRTLTVARRRRRGARRTPARSVRRRHLHAGARAAL